MAWITTKDGKHINTDWFDKDKQIADNKKEADDRNKPVIEASKPTKNAEEAFKYIYTTARNLIKRGDDTDTIAGGFNYKGDDTPALSTQALKGIQAKINSERNNLKMDLQLGISSKEEIDRKTKALDIVQRTLNDKVKGK
jgi:hypothetical protein